VTPALAWCSARLRPAWPGIAVPAVIALAAAFVSEHYGGPPLLYALFFGISFHFLAEDERCKPGIDFCGSVLLRVGVALLGARVTVTQIASLGLEPIVIVAAAVVSTILLGWLLAKRCGRPAAEGILSGGAVAICGASAALAIAAVLPQNRDNERHALLIVVGVTTLSTAAMILYPLVAAWLELDPRAAGVFIGGSIHDVAQVVGAGYVISDETGDVATVVKLARVLCLVPVVFVLALAYGARRTGSEGSAHPGSPLVPWFLYGFVALVIANSAGMLSPSAQDTLGAASRACLVLAIAALGVKTSFQALATLGWRPVLMLAAESAWIALFVLGALWTWA
jgi:uncharacterized integral membrane protein (TIGR00698 family)